MANYIQDTEEFVEKNEKLIDIWGRKSPKFEKKYQNSVLEVLSDYGKGATELTSARGKLLGAGYEVYIMAFFIGLYSGKKLPLSENTEDVKTLGHPIGKWGNIDKGKNDDSYRSTSKLGRKSYPELRFYIFTALVAKTDIDWIAVDKGEMKISSAVAKLFETMEEYANYGFAYMEEKLKEDKGFFFSPRAFLDIFLQLTDKQHSFVDEDDNPEEL